MNKKLNCEQVLALISFYKENILHPKLKESINIHLNKCAKCQKAYNEFDDEIKSLYSQDNDFISSTDRSFQNTLSAYIDNELNTKENLKVRKTIITNPAVRDKANEMYNLRILLNNSYKKSKNEFKKDYSKSTINTIKNGKFETKKALPVYKLVGAFTATITIIVVSVLTLLYF